MHRQPNDINRLLEQYVTAFALEFPERKKDSELLRRVVNYISPQLADLPKTIPYYGMIHGDVIRANVQVSNRTKITILDFDLSALGWRIYDIASFLITLHGPNGIDFKHAYLGGYNAVRPLDSFEQGLIPLFKAIREVRVCREIRQWIFSKRYHEIR